MAEIAMPAATTETTAGPAPAEGEWAPTACILCACNCGVEVQVADGNISRVKGDKAHPGSKGYACEKAQRLPYYQRNERITSPLRRRPDGSYEEVDWDTAITEVAAGLAGVRDAHGGESIFYYGGGGQGNHLGGSYSGATRSALGVRFSSNALAQEKTGEMWVDAHLFGHVSHTAPDFERAEVAVFVGKNPWMAHGIPHTRPTLKAIASDDARSLIVIDPRRSETAALADIHLQVRPGTDAFVLAAMLATLVQEDLLDHAFLEEHAEKHAEVVEAVAGIDVDEYATRADVDPGLVRAAARRIGEAASVSILEDLGIQQAPHSTLNSYLEKLLWALTGNFARPGCTNLHTAYSPNGLFGKSRESKRRTPGTGERVIAGMFPSAAIPDAVLSDDPCRFRAAIIESSNPVHTLPDSPRMREAMAALDFSVVIDITMTETAACASYVLPAASQYEKYECTFFNLEFPHNVFHLRHPVLQAPEGVLTEPEIHARLVRALGAYTDQDLAGLRDAAEDGLDAYAAAFAARMSERPDLMGIAAVVLYETLGPTLPDGAASAASLWGAAQMCALTYADSLRGAGFEGEGMQLGNALFTATLAADRGLTFTVDDHDANWRWIERHRPSRKLDLAIPELLEELAALVDEQPEHDPDYPFVLSAGERRSNTAMTLMRDPEWRKRDPEGRLRVSPQDAERLGLADGDRARITTRRGSRTAPVEISDTLRPGHVSLPNGYGVAHGHNGPVTGIAPNELTTGDRRDLLAGTPWHKTVPARVEATNAWPAPTFYSAMARQTDAREQMIKSAALLIRERGVQGTSFNDVIEHSGAPRGSIYHHFSGGKTQLAEEAVRWAGQMIIAHTISALEDDDPVAAMAAVRTQWARVLRESEFRAGCPVVAATLEGNEYPQLRAAADDVFDRWQNAVTVALERHGLAAARARSLSTLILASIEGALVLARAHRSTEPLERVTRELQEVVGGALDAGDSRQNA